MCDGSDAIRTRSALPICKAHDTLAVQYYTTKCYNSQVKVSSSLQHKSKACCVSPSLTSAEYPDVCSSVVCTSAGEPDVRQSQSHTHQPSSLMSRYMMASVSVQCVHSLLSHTAIPIWTTSLTPRPLAISIVCVRRIAPVRTASSEVRQEATQLYKLGAEPLVCAACVRCM